VSEFIVDYIVLHCSASIVNYECFHCGLHCLVRVCVRLQPASLKRQARGASSGAAHTWCMGSCLGAGHSQHICDAWVAYLCAGRPKAQVALGLLP
jgi:hypothetical protein